MSSPAAPLSTAQAQVIGQAPQQPVAQAISPQPPPAAHASSALALRPADLVQASAPDRHGQPCQRLSALSGVLRFAKFGQGYARRGAHVSTSRDQPCRQFASSRAAPWLRQDTHGKRHPSVPPTAGLNKPAELQQTGEGITPAPSGMVRVLRSGPIAIIGTVGSLPEASFRGYRDALARHAIRVREGTFRLQGDALPLFLDQLCAEQVPFVVEEGAA